MEDDFQRRYASVAEADQTAFLQRELALLKDAIAADGLEPLQIQTWMDELAHVLESRNQMESAIDLRQQLLAFSLEHVSDEHVATIGHMENLAKDLYRVEQYHSAAELFSHVLEVRRRSLGELDPVTLETQSDLATTLVRDGQFQRAIELSQDLLLCSKQEFGLDDQRTVKAGELLENARKWEEAVDSEE
jgi:hypothetical protein